MIAISARRFIDENDKLISRVDIYAGIVGLRNALVENIAFNNTIVLNLDGMKTLKKFPPGPSPYFDSWIYLLFSTLGSIERIDRPLVKYRLHENNLVGVHGISEIFEARESLKLKVSQVREFQQKTFTELSRKDRILIENFLAISDEVGIVRRIFLAFRFAFGFRRQSKLHTVLFLLLLIAN